MTKHSVSGNEINFFIGYVPSKPYNNASAKTVAKWKSDRKHYTCNGTTSYLSYMKTGNADDDDTSNLDYLKQEHRHIPLGKERSLGLFDRDGMCSEEKEKQHRKALRETNSNIWKGVITFENEFGEKYCSTSNQAITAMKYVMSKFIETTQLKADNVTYVAALHTNTEHYHIHFQFFEKYPKVMNKYGMPSYTIKGKLPLDSIDYAKDCFFRHFVDRSVNVYDMRNETLRYIKSSVGDIDNNNNPSYLEFKALAQNFTSLDTKYDNLPKDKKDKLDQFVVRLINRDDTSRKMFDDVFEKLTTAKEMHRQFRGKLNGKEIITSKHDYFRQDYFSRVGQVVLDGVNRHNNYSHQRDSLIRTVSLRRGGKMETSKKYKFKQEKNNLRKLCQKTFDSIFGKVGQVEIERNYHWLEIVRQHEEMEQRREEDQRLREKFQQEAEASRQNQGYDIGY